ncbi:MAG: hypothetical protein AAB975_01370 [Patescibacteria group bacterium]
MCFNPAITRRECVGIAAGILLSFELSGCAQAEAPPSMPTIELPDKVERMTHEFTERTLNSITRLSRRIGSSLRLIFRTVDGKVHALVLSFEKREKFSHSFPMVRNEDGSTLHLMHAGTGQLHDVGFLSPDREFLVRMQERLKHLWSMLKDAVHGQDPLTLGIKAVAVGVGLWIGVVLAKVVLASLAFFLFYALMIALVVMGAMAIASFFQGRSVRERIDRLQERFMEKRSHFPDLLHAISS